MLLDGGTGGLFDLDFSLFDVALLIELLRDIDGDLETELSRDDLVDELFSDDRSLLFSTLFSGELSFESLSLLAVGLYFGNDDALEPLKRE